MASVRFSETETYQQGRKLVSFRTQRGEASLTADENELRDIEDGLAAYRRRQYGVRQREVTASLVQKGDIIPCLGMTVTHIYPSLDSTDVVLANEDSSILLRLHPTVLLTINRRIK